MCVCVPGERLSLDVSPVNNSVCVCGGGEGGRG